MGPDEGMRSFALGELRAMYPIGSIVGQRAAHAVSALVYAVLDVADAIREQRSSEVPGDVE